MATHGQLGLQFRPVLSSDASLSLILGVSAADEFFLFVRRAKQ